MPTCHHWQHRRFFHLGSSGNTLTHWGQVTYICISELTIGSDNGLPPGRRQVIIWPNDGILLIGSLGTNLSQILIKIYKFSFKKKHWKMLSGKWRPTCLGLIVLTNYEWTEGTASTFLITDVQNSPNSHSPYLHFEKAQLGLLFLTEISWDLAMDE